MCQRCGTRPKKPGPGQRYCPECREFLDKDVMGRASARERIAYAARSEKPKRHFAKDAPAGTKWCPGCQQYLVIKSFGTRGKGKLAANCRDCDKDKQWIRHVQRKYGITAEQYGQLLSSQGGACAVCGTRPKRKRLAVDHDHQTGYVRGLLCTSCNHRVIGGAKEDASILRAAADYLDRPPAFNIIGEVKPDGQEG
jgi:hypothetical protein